MRKYFTEILILLFIFILPFVLHWQLFTKLEADIRLIGNDFLTITYPANFFQATSIRGGEFPLWLPLISNGFPFIGDPLPGAFYPLNILMALFVHNDFLSYRISEAFQIFHYALAGILMYFFARRLKIGRFGAILAAIVFMFNGRMFDQLRHSYMMAVEVWMPLILLFLDKALREKKIVFSVFAGLVFGISILGGHPQASLYVAFLAVAYSFFVIWDVGIRSIFSQDAIKQLVCLGVFVLAGFGLSAISLLPIAEYIKFSMQGVLNYDYSTLYAMPPQDVVSTFILPHLASFESWAYVGILPLILAIMAVIRRPSREVFFFLLLVIVAIGYSLGANSFLHGFFYTFIPGFNQSRAPGRFMFIGVFFLSILAAFGADFLEKNTQDVKELVRKILTPLVYFTLLLTAGFIFISFLPQTKTFLTQTPLAYEKFSALDAYSFSLLTFFLSIFLLYFYSRVDKVKFILMFLTILFIIFDLGSFGRGVWYVPRPLNDPYQSMSEPALRPDLERMETPETIYAEGMNRSIIKKTASTNGFFAPEIARTGRSWNFYGFAKDKPVVKSLLNTRKDVAVFLPRAFTVPKAKVISDEQKILADLGSHGFSPLEYLIAEEYLPKDQENLILTDDKNLLGVTASAKLKDFNDVKITRYKNNSVELATKTDKPEFLFMSEGYYPGWKAYVDGKETKIYRANYAFRAIVLNPGEHQVKFSFEPRSFKIGALISGLTLFATLIFLILPRFLKRKTI